MVRWHLFPLQMVVLLQVLVVNSAIMTSPLFNHGVITRNSWGLIQSHPVHISQIWQNTTICKCQIWWLSHKTLLLWRLIHPLTWSAIKCDEAARSHQCQWSSRRSCWIFASLNFVQLYFDRGIRVRVKLRVIHSRCARRTLLKASKRHHAFDKPFLSKDP